MEIKGLPIWNVTDIEKRPPPKKEVIEEDFYDLDICVKENSEPQQPVDCSSETCNCKTRACHTYNVGSCQSCGCTNWNCR